MTHRILVVDDEPALREVLAEYLRGRGMSVDAVSDAESACDEIVQARPDAVVTDLHLPGADGLSVVRAAARQGIPCILTTGYGTLTISLEAWSIGASGLLLKPFALRDLHGALTRALSEAMEARRRAWSLAALTLLSAAARTPAAEAEALVPAMVELFRACPDVRHAAVVRAFTAEDPASRPVLRLDAHRVVEIDPCPPSAAAVVAGVAAALARQAP